MKQPGQSAEESARTFADLVEIVRRLRAPGGCPWDRKQTPESLKAFVVEEAYEVLDAIDSGSPEALCEELGDLLLQILLQSAIASESGQFGIGDVIRGISDKLVSRHPHVFGSIAVKDADEVLTNWEKLKKKEKADRGLFDGLPQHLPALLRAARMGEKASRIGFDWPDTPSVREKVQEELGELERAVASGDSGAIRHETGDLLFAVAQWARHLGKQPEESLREACNRFADRFRKMETIAAEEGRSIADLDLEQMEALWQRAKKGS